MSPDAPHRYRGRIVTNDGDTCNGGRGADGQLLVGKCWTPGCARWGQSRTRPAPEAPCDTCGGSRGLRVHYVTARRKPSLSRTLRLIAEYNAGR